MSVEHGQRLVGKVAIVSGAGSRGPGVGNGKASAILFARHGARVALVDRELARAEETLAIIEREGGQAIALGADVTDPVACQQLVDRTVERFGGLQILFNNVGIIGPTGTALEVELEGWERLLRLNVTSHVLMAQAAIPAMVRSGGGSIINMASVAGLSGGSPTLGYPTSKGAVVNMTRAMAVHHAPQGIRVNCLAPGTVYTPMVASGMSEEVREARRHRSLLQTEGTAWDVAMAAVFLASDEARWITGVALPVDAGATAGQSESPVPRSDAG